MKNLLLALSILFSSSTFSHQNNFYPNVTIDLVYMHDCCDRGPYIAIQLDQTGVSAASCSQGGKNVFYIRPDDVMAENMLEIAMEAKRNNASVDIWGTGECGRVGIWEQWIGIKMY